MVGPGYGMEINNGRVLTALHVALKMDFPVIYANTDKDIAVIETGHKNKYKLKFASSVSDFIFTDIVPQPGESGKPYIAGGAVRGVIIGESEGFGIAAALDETLIRFLTGSD